jgi:hypothetical protein
MKITTKQILGVLYVVSWIIFVGLCVETGGFMFNAIFTFRLGVAGAKHFWQEVDLSNLYQVDRGYFFVITFLMCIVSIMRCLLFFLILKVLANKKLDMSLPFNKDMGRFIFRISYLTCAIGLFSFWGTQYSEWLNKKGIVMPDTQFLRLGGADVWLFMSVVLLIIAQMFKRGIELQSENELTV